MGFHQAFILATGFSQAYGQGSSEARARAVTMAFGQLTLVLSFGTAARDPRGTHALSASVFGCLAVLSGVTIVVAAGTVRALRDEEEQHSLDGHREERHVQGREY